MLLTRKWEFMGLRTRTTACVLVVFQLIRSSGGTLTQGATVTADSFLNNGDINYSNCVNNNNLVDGKFPPFGDSNRCCLHTISSSTFSWVNINMGSKVVVQTVLIIVREDVLYTADNIKGADLYVGNDALPNINTSCGALPQSAGVYQCAGLIGKYLGIFKNNVGSPTDWQNISQIRAYSYKDNAYSNFSYLTSSPLVTSGPSDCSSSTNLVYWSGHLSTPTCARYVAGPNAWYKIVFDTRRFVHTVTLVGQGTVATDFVFAQSKNWFVTVGDQTDITLNTEYGKFVNDNYDRFGKEIKVGAYGTIVAIRRNDESELAFRWVAVFTTKSDCSGPFDWTKSRQDWSILLTTTAQSITDKIGAEIDDCAVYHDILVLSDGSALPSFMQYNIQTKLLTIDISSSQAPVQYTIKACAYLDDRVTSAKYECKEIQVCLYGNLKATSLYFTEPNFTYQYVVSGQLTEFQLPAITKVPIDASTFLQWRLIGAPSFLSLFANGSTARVFIDTSCLLVGSFQYQVEVKDNLTQKIATLDATYISNPPGFTIFPNSLALEIQGPSQTLTWTQDFIATCGTYTAAVDTAFVHLLTISGQQIIAAAPANAQVGTFNTVITFRRDSNTAHTTTTLLSLVVYNCNPTGFTISPSSLALEIQGESQSLNWTIDSLNSRCGTYSTIFDPAFANLFTISGQYIIAQAQAAAQVGAFNTVIEYRRNSNTAHSTTASLQLLVFNCNPTVLIISQSSLTLEIGGDSQIINWTQDSLNSGCGSYSAAVDPAFTYLITLSGQQIIAQAPATALVGTYNPAITFKRDSNVAHTQTVSLQLLVFNCNPTGFTISPNSLALEIQGTSKSLNWTMDSLNSNCGTYSATFDLAFAHLFTISGQQIIAQAQAAAQIGQFNPDIKLSRNSNMAHTTTASLQLVVYSCNPTGFTITPSQFSLEIEGASLSLNWTKDSLNVACGTYSVTVDPAFAHLLTISGQQIIAAAPADAQVGTFNAVITLSRDSNTANTSSVSLQLVVKRPQITALKLDSAAKIKVTYTIGKIEQKITFPKYSCQPKGCLLDLNYVVALISKKPDIRFNNNSQLNKQTTLLPSLLKYNPTEFTIHGTDYSEGWNNYLIRVTVIEKTATQLQDNSFILEVETSVDCVTNVELFVPDSFSKEISYTIGSFNQTTVYPYPSALDSLSRSTGIAQICGPVVCVVNQTDSIGSGSSPLPSFIKFSPSLMSLSINITDSSNSGDYYLLFDYYFSYFIADVDNKHTKRLAKLTAFASKLDLPAWLNQTIPNITSTSESEKADNQNQIQTTFIENLSTEIVIYASEHKEVVVGEIKDDGSTVTLESIKLSCGISNDWIKLPEATDSIKDIRLIVNVPPDVQDDTCEVQINLVQLKQRAQQPHQLKTTLKIVSQTFKGYQVPVNEQAKVDTKSPDILKSAISQGGTVTIEFSRDIYLPKDIYNLTSENGGLKYFNITLVVHEANLQEYAESNNQRKQQQNKLIITERRRLSQSDLYGFKWSIFKAKKLDQLKFDFNFNNPEIISVHGSDKIIIDLMRTGLITSPDQLNAALFKPQEIVLPMQIASKQEAALIKGAVQAVSSGMSVFLSGNFFMTAFTSLVIYYLWGMINSLQLIALTCLFRIRLPANIFAFNKQILKLANFDLFQTEWLIQKVFKFSESTSFNDSFDQAGYGGSNFIIGIGMMGISIFFYILFLGIRETVLRWFHDEQFCLQKIYPWFKSHNVEVTIIRFVLEGTMDVFFWALIAILHVRDTRSLGPKFSDKLSNIISIAFLLLIIYAPVHTIYRAIQLNQLQKNKKQGKALTAEQELQNSMIRLLFEEFNENLPSLLYNLIFIIRRQILVTILIFLPNYGNFQVSIYLVSAFFMVTYGILVKPYENETLNKQEISNELYILVSSYFMLIFSGWIPDDQKLTGTNLNVKNTMGRAMFAFIALNILTNIAIVGRALALKAKLDLRQRKIRRMHLKKIELKALTLSKKTKIKQRPAFNIDETFIVANNSQLVNDNSQIVDISEREIMPSNKNEDCSLAESSPEDGDQFSDIEHASGDEQVMEYSNQGSKKKKPANFIYPGNPISKNKKKIKKKTNKRRKIMTKDQTILLKNQIFKPPAPATFTVKEIALQVGVPMEEEKGDPEWWHDAYSPPIDTQQRQQYEEAQRAKLEMGNDERYGKRR